MGKLNDVWSEDGKGAMRKISYRSKEEARPVPLDVDSEVLNVGSEDPISRPDGSAGIISPEIRDLIVDDDNDSFQSEYDGFSDDLDPDVLEALNDLFVITADVMDRGGDYDSANFMDFLIKKYAESKDIDYSKKFNDLLFKVRDSSVGDINNLMIELADIYSKKIKEEVSLGKDIFNAKESAYISSVSFLNNFFEGHLK